MSNPPLRYQVQYVVEMQKHSKFDVSKWSLRRIGQELGNCPVEWFVLLEGCVSWCMLRKGPCPPLYSLGDRVIWNPYIACTLLAKKYIKSTNHCQSLIIQAYPPLVLIMRCFYFFTLSQMIEIAEAKKIAFHSSLSFLSHKAVGEAVLPYSFFSFTEKAVLCL